MMPLANSFLKKEDLDKTEPSFPLTVFYCKQCSLIQLCDVVDGSLMFNDYHYLTSASKPLAEHFCRLGEDVVSHFIKDKNELVVEIGSNDGVLLESMKGKCRTLGVDPAENVVELARKRGVETICGFFGVAMAQEIISNKGQAKVVVANNVVAHVDNLYDLFNGVKKLLSEDGVFIFEVHWVGNLIGEGGFDQIYHEHLSYFSLHSLNVLSEIMGMKILDVKLVPVHGQSLRLYMGKAFETGREVGKILDHERKLGIDKIETYKTFSEKVERNKVKLTNIINDLKRENKKIVGYGAPAKGNTLLNFFNLDSSLLDYLTDTTPLKQGLYTPGTHIPIFPPEKMMDITPDYVLLLAWNYADAILTKEKALREKGVKFIIPVPEVKIV
jgi:SAM-dependent methyltransferase